MVFICPPLLGLGAAHVFLFLGKYALAAALLKMRLSGRRGISVWRRLRINWSRYDQVGGVMLRLEGRDCIGSDECD